SKQIKGEFRKFLPKRRRDSHKGDYGRIFVLAGSRGLTGAAFLVSIACLRSGAGLITLGIPTSLSGIMALKLTEIMTMPLAETRAGSLGIKAYGEISNFLEKQDVLAIGPGLSRNEETQRLVRKVVLGSRKPMVIDADGLNAFEGHLQNLKRVKAEAILAPHPGEYERLFGKKLPQSEGKRKEAALRIARKYGVVCVLKGYRTVIADSSGKVFINSTGNPGLATGGSGDILTGIIAAFLGQGMPAFYAAKLGCFIHGLAADIAAKKTGEIALIPTDVVNYLPNAFKVVGHR
ncbi:MAG: NAD(P)H-hydrate dehydratase, partial [Candidatus Omnitrophica bacterium]|nr:NAD(P)H-hydrate dehydratase [Candidatus Omnitrophota bacterium]